MVSWSGYETSRPGPAGTGTPDPAAITPGVPTETSAPAPEPPAPPVSQPGPGRTSAEEQRAAQRDLWRRMAGRASAARYGDQARRRRPEYSPGYRPGMGRKT